MSIAEIYISYLRRAVFSASFLPESLSWSQQDWSSFIQLCQRQATAPLVFNEVLKDAATGQIDVPSAYLTHMKSVCAHNMLSQQQFLLILHQTWSALSSSLPNPPLLLKGFALAELYPHPDLRTWGDLDVYVGPDNYHAAAQILRATFPQAIHPNEEGEDLKHYNFDFPDGNAVEMHRATMTILHPRAACVYDALEKEGVAPEHIFPLTLSSASNLQVHIPELKFNLLFTFLHAWHHFVDTGIGMKHFCDLALLAHFTAAHISFSDLESYLRPNLRKLHLTEAWNMMGYICVEKLGLAPSEWVYPAEKHTNSHTITWNSWTRQQGERMFSCVMNGGSCHPYSPERVGQNKYEERDRRRHLPWLQRKLLTLKMNLMDAHYVYPFSPEYARHMIATTLFRGFLRTIHGTKLTHYHSV